MSLRFRLSVLQLRWKAFLIGDHHVFFKIWTAKNDMNEFRWHYYNLLKLFYSSQTAFVFWRKNRKWGLSRPLVWKLKLVLSSKPIIPRLEYTLWLILMIIVVPLHTKEVSVILGRQIDCSDFENCIKVAFIIVLKYVDIRIRFWNYLFTISIPFPHERLPGWKKSH